jgi:hypothetical protein
MTLTEEIQQSERDFNDLAKAVSDQISTNKQAHDLFWRMYHDYCDIQTQYRDSLRILVKEYNFHIH